MIYEVISILLKCSENHNEIKTLCAAISLPRFPPRRRSARLPCAFDSKQLSTKEAKQQFSQFSDQTSETAETAVDQADFDHVTQGCAMLY